MVSKQYTAYHSFCEIIKKIQDSFSKLEVAASVSEIEKLATIIGEGMSGPGRVYHNAQHVLELSEGMEPQAVLAALFHDIVYYQIDGGVEPQIHLLLEPYYSVIHGTLYTKSPNQNDYFFELLLELFDLKIEQKLLPQNGQNEFLSALVAIRLLQDKLPNKILFAIILCIEETIPFRACKEHYKRLKDKIERLNNKYQIGMDKEELNNTLKIALFMANKDVDNFATEDVSIFLQNTWKLLPEANARLSTQALYRIKEYRIAIEKMENFLSSLQVETIFHDINGENKEYANQIKYAKRNLLIACKYLQMKLLSISLLEAIAQATGGDIPVLFLMGDIEKGSGRLEQYLPDFSSIKKANDTEEEILALLHFGRNNNDINFDTKSSGLSSYIYKLWGKEKAQENLKIARKFIRGKVTSQEFLRKIETEVLQNICSACARICITRTHQLFALSTNL